MQTDTETKTVKIIPHFGNTIEWMAVNMAQKGFVDFSYGPMRTILQTFGYMVKHDPETAERILRNLEHMEKHEPTEPHPEQDDSLYEQDGDQ